MECFPIWIQQQLQTKEAVEQKYLAHIESLTAKWECEKNSALHDQLLRYLHDLSEPMTVNDHVVAIRALLEKELLGSRLQFSWKLEEGVQEQQQEQQQEDEEEKRPSVNSEDLTDSRRSIDLSSLSAAQLYEHLCDTIERHRLHFEDLCGSLIKEVNAAKDTVVLNENNRLNQLQNELAATQTKLADVTQQLRELQQRNESLKTQMDAAQNAKIEALRNAEEVSFVELGYSSVGRLGDYFFL